MSIPLTKPNPELARQIAMTPKGMAHWAGTGPSGKTCGECEHHGEIPWGIGVSFRCNLYTKMMDGQIGSKRIPEATPSCKYFEER